MIILIFIIKWNDRVLIIYSGFDIIRVWGWSFVILTQGNVKKSEYANKLISKVFKILPFVSVGGGRLFCLFASLNNKKIFPKTLKPKQFNPHTFFSSFLSPRNCLFVQAHNLIKVIPIHGRKKSQKKQVFVTQTFS